MIIRYGDRKEITAKILVFMRKCLRMKIKTHFVMRFYQKILPLTSTIPLTLFYTIPNLTRSTREKRWCFSSPPSFNPRISYTSETEQLRRRSTRTAVIHTFQIGHVRILHSFPYLP